MAWLHGVRWFSHGKSGFLAGGRRDAGKIVEWQALVTFAVSVMNQEPKVDAANRGQTSTIGTIIILILAIYLLPLIAVAVDELVLHTFWFVRTFPDGSRSIFFNVYPFLHWFIDS
jgi:hypothetical protein